MDSFDDSLAQGGPLTKDQVREFKEGLSAALDGPWQPRLLSPVVDDCPSCLDCGGRLQVVWCPAWDAYLCASCRTLRVDKEFRTVTALPVREVSGLD